MSLPPDPPQTSGPVTAAERAPSRGRALRTVAKILLAVGLVGFLFASGRIDLDRLLSIERPSDLFLAQVFWLSAFLVTVLRWHYLLAALDVPARFRDALRLCGLGMFFSQVIPGATGGDIVRGIQIARESPGRRTNAVLSVLLDRVLGLTALMMLGVIGVLGAPPELLEDPLLARLRGLLLGLLGAIGFGGTLLLLPGPWTGDGVLTPLFRLPGGRLLRSLVLALQSIRNRGRTLAVGVLLSLLAHTLFVGTAVFLSRALTSRLPDLANFAFLVPIGQLAFSLPLTPGGTGVGQWAYDELFVAVGEDHGAELAVLLQLTSVLWGVVGVLTLFHGGRDVRRELAETRAALGNEPGTNPEQDPRTAEGPERARGA